jgi:hypothetical protein
MRPWESVATPNQSRCCDEAGGAHLPNAESFLRLIRALAVEMRNHRLEAHR